MALQLFRLKLGDELAGVVRFEKTGICLSPSLTLQSKDGVIGLAEDEHDDLLDGESLLARAFPCSPTQLVDWNTRFESRFGRSTLPETFRAQQELDALNLQSDCVISVDETTIQPTGSRMPNQSHRGGEAATHNPPPDEDQAARGARIFRRYQELRRAQDRAPTKTIATEERVTRQRVEQILDHHRPDWRDSERQHPGYPRRIRLLG